MDFCSYLFSFSFGRMEWVDLRNASYSLVTVLVFVSLMVLQSESFGAPFSMASFVEAAAQYHPPRRYIFQG